MDKFNLTFSGEILPGQDMAEVKVRVAQALGIDDPEYIDRLFSGEEISLQQDVDKHTAEDLYTKLYRAGAVLTLVPILQKSYTPSPQMGMSSDFHRGVSGNVEQSWPLKHTSSKRPPAATTSQKRGNAVLLAEQQEQKKISKATAKRKNKKQLAAQVAKKQSAEKIAKLRVELAQLKRHHAQQAAQALADEQRTENELQGLIAAQKTQDTALAATVKQEKTQRQKAPVKKAKRRRSKKEPAQGAKRHEEEQRQEKAALVRAAQGTARLKELQKNTLRVKPSARAAKAEQVADIPRHQPGAPNLFSLKPFRYTVEIRKRAEKSRGLMKAMFALSVVSLLVLLILGTYYALSRPTTAAVSGPDAIVVAPDSGLIITAGNRLFSLDRAGVERDSYPLSDLGIDSQTNLLGFNSAGRLIVQVKHPSRHNTDPDEKTLTQSTWRTLRCDTEKRECQPAMAEIPLARASSYVLDSRTNEAYLTFPSEGVLTKIADDGTLLARKQIAMPEQANLVLHEGLLYMSSTAGSAISIFRPDDKGFGNQLDEILLRPAPALEKQQTQLAALLWSTGSWWVAMMNPDTLEASLYRFDANWNFIATVPTTLASRWGHLLGWSNKVLLTNAKQPAIQRFNAQGKLEAPLAPPTLQNYIETAQYRSALSKKLWQLALGILALMGIGSYVLGRLHHLRSLVYDKGTERGAEPIDDKEKRIRWIDRDANRDSSYKRLATLYTILCLSLLALFYVLALPASTILAAALLFIGPAIALTLIWSSKVGHIGVYNGQLILVDQHDMYHMGSGARLYYRSNFLLLDDIVVFIGTRKLPIFSTSQLASDVVPLALAGIKIDRKTVLTKLIQSSHPIATGLYACAGALGSAIMCLLLY